MDTKNFVLSYYKNSTQNFHIHKVEKAFEARKPYTHDYFQIYYIAKGSLAHFLENESSRLSHGDMFIIPPGKTHFIASDDDAVFYSISFMPDFLGESTLYNKLSNNFLRSLQTDGSKNLRPKVSIAPDEIFYVENIMEQILKEFTQKPLGSDEAILAYVILLITILARSYFENVKSAINDHFENNKQFVLHCIEYVENNFADNISLEEISKRSAMSKSNFCVLFSKLTGYSFNNYLNLCRIKKSTDFIKNGYKISAVYGLCGYNDFSTFYRNFKKIMGMSPRVYKLQLDAKK